MKERPILFSAEMVRAILDGRKTQTRRIVKPAHLATSEPVEAVLAQLSDAVLAQAPIFCPHGQTGDRLWVKETHRFPSKENPRVRVEYRADMSSWGIADSHDVTTNTVVADAKLFPGPANEYSKQHWRPSIFMPRWASRITLEITAVRVERLQSMSEQDAKAEGIFLNDRAWWAAENGIDTKALTPGGGYRALWNKINGDGAWAENPWVWVIEFRRLA